MRERRAASRSGLSDSKRDSADSFVGEHGSVSNVASFSSSAKSSAKSLRGSNKELPEGEQASDENFHRVTLCVTIAVAYPRPAEDQSKMLEELARKNKKIVDAPRPNYFLHCDYVIAPKYDPTLTDIVTYPVAAKVFTENDSRVVKTWDDGEKLWVAWIHSHEVAISLKNITSLHNHAVNVTFWDSKEKMSQKARTDRPKAFRLPSATEVRLSGRGVGGVVDRQSASWLNMQPRDSVAGLVDPQNVDNPPLDPEPELPEPVPIKKRETRIRSSSSRVISANATNEDKKRINDLKRRQSKLQRQLVTTERRASVLAADSEKASKSDKKGKRVESSRVAGSPKGKPVTIQVKLEGLFAGSKSITSRLVDKSGTVMDGYVTVAVDGDSIFPAQLEQTLNPLIITLKSVKDLPDTPTTQQHLDRICQPVYCKYNFFNQSPHATPGRPHGKHVYFESTHVIFLGLLNEGELREYIQGNSFVVEVHDRDQLDDPDNSGDAALFGSENTDHKISNVGLVSSKRTSYNAFQSKNKAFDPFGIARIPLLDILRGHTTIHSEVAVTPCSMPEVLKEPSPREGKEARLVGVPGAVDRPERPPQLPGHYVQAGTSLKLKMRLRCPFVPPANVPRLLPLPNQMCIYSRVIYYFSYGNKEMLRRIENAVTVANAKALGLEHFEKDVIDAALSTYKLTVEQKRSKTLDVITGFHVIDGNLHLMVLEGLRDKAMEQLHNTVQKIKTEDEQFLVHLYDTSMSFSSRLYANLDVDLCRVRLHETISDIMNQPLLYVRDMIPRDCFECVRKCQQITHSIRLRDVVYSNSFPTADMVISMSREFGIPLTYEDFEVQPKIKSEKSPKEDIALDKSDFTLKEREVANAGTSLQSTSIPLGANTNSKSTNLDNSNVEFDALMRRRQTHPRKLDYVTYNIVAVQEAGKRRRPSHPSVRTLKADDLPAHNYSSQTLNSTEMAKNILRDMLRENDPDGRYAYHPVYNSAMLIPRHVDSFYKEEDAKSKRRWKTEEGFVYPGMRSSHADNEHPLKPDDSRRSDLKLCFKDNILHRNIMAPILSRDKFTWDEREKDLNLYGKPTPDFGSAHPGTIHSAGDRKVLEEKLFKRGEAETWRQRLVVDDPLMRFHRLLWATEDSNDATQLDRLTGLLKDEAKKLSLASHPAPVIPPLSVVMNPSVDTAARMKGVKLPPAFDESIEQNVGYLPGPFSSRRWVMEENRIPIKDEKHKHFAQKHGHDMNVYHKERTMLANPLPVKPLTEEELKTHLFRIPPISPRQNDDKEAEFKLPRPRSEDRYGEGPRDSSEYRFMFPGYDVIGRAREIYPRHTFDGFTHLNKDGKPITRDASIQLIATETDAPPSERLKTDNTAVGVTRPIPGEMRMDDASIEVTPQLHNPMQSVDVA